ncbi:MAG: response regulator transcription factor, partial [Alcanivoracaceae bacterium]|nr:response regulator transcription factor [Alcanivoracaceae bacterium]
SYLTLIRILELEGNVMRSHRLTQHLERILKLGNYDRFHAQVIHEQMRQAYRSSDAERIDWLVAEYHLRERYAAGEWSKARHYDEEWERSGLAVAMWLQHQNQLARAEQVLHAVAETLRAQGANARAVVADANLVVIAWQGGDNELAFARLKQLVERYGIECLNRTALDEAPGLYQVIQHAASQQQVLLPPLYLEMFASVIARAAIVVEKPKEEAPVEALTEREKDILNLLRKGISNREIGELSGLAVTTIKWHIKNIFAKLGVTSRAEAIVMANRSPARFGIKEQRSERAG